MQWLETYTSRNIHIFKFVHEFNKICSYFFIADRNQKQFSSFAEFLFEQVNVVNNLSQIIHREVKDRSKNYPRSVQYGTVQMVLLIISIHLHQSSKWNVVHCSAKLYFINYILFTSLQANDVVMFQISKFSKLEVHIIFLIREMKLTGIYISLNAKSWKFIISFYIYKFLIVAVEENDVQECLFEIVV